MTTQETKIVEEFINTLNDQCRWMSNLYENESVASRRLKISVATSTMKMGFISGLCATIKACNLDLHIVDIDKAITDAMIEKLKTL